MIHEIPNFMFNHDAMIEVPRQHPGMPVHGLYVGLNRVVDSPIKAENQFDAYRVRGLAPVFRFPAREC